MDARTQRIRDAIARLEGAFPRHQANAILGFAEALGTEPQVARDTEPAPAEQAQAPLASAEGERWVKLDSNGLHSATLVRAVDRFRGLLDAWDIAIATGGKGPHEARRLEICAGNLREAINRVEAGNV